MTVMDNHTDQDTAKGLVAEASRLESESADIHPNPLINLLPAKVEPVPEDHHATDLHHRVWLATAGIAAMLTGAGGAAVYDVLTPPAQVAQVTREVKATPLPTAKPVVTPSPSPAASPTPVATPAPTPAPSAATTVTAPAVTPTAEKPQTVTVTSKNGMWFRSTPTSVNNDNIIGWLPNGAQISVDEVGDFWWHGTYKGKTGYFASKHTQ